MSNNPPSLAEIAAAMKVLHTPEAQGIQKHISMIIVAAVIGIGAWMMTSVSAMQSSIAQVSSSVLSMQKTIDEMSKDAKDDSNEKSDMKENMARLEQRVSQNEQRLNSLDGRGASNGYTSRPQSGSTAGSAQGL